MKDERIRREGRLWFRYGARYMMGEARRRRRKGEEMTIGLHGASRWKRVGDGGRGYRIPWDMLASRGNIRYAEERRVRTRTRREGSEIQSHPIKADYTSSRCPRSRCYKRVVQIKGARMGYNAGRMRRLFMRQQLQLRLQRWRRILQPGLIRGTVQP